MIFFITLVPIDHAIEGKFEFYELQHCCSAGQGFQRSAPTQCIFYRSRGLSDGIKPMAYFFNGNAVKEIGPLGILLCCSWLSKDRLRWLVES